MKVNPRTTVFVMAILCVGLTAFVQAAEPQALRFRAATVTTPDLRAFERDYVALLGYRVRERGRVARSLATSWGTQRMQGRRYVLMSSDAAPEVVIRAIETRPTPNYRALTTHGWNAIEVVVKDPDTLRGRVGNTPFKVIGEPEFLGGYPTIRAFQVLGTSAEVLYLTAETGDRSRSPLPDPGGEVGRIFIMVLAGPDIHALNSWYAEKFNLTAGVVNDRKVGVLTRAQNLAPNQTVPLTTLRFAQQGNLIELDGYPATSGPRPVRRGELPPGIAIVTIGVRNLDALPLRYLQAARRHEGPLYRGQRSATVRGPANELLELVEE